MGMRRGRTTLSDTTLETMSLMVFLAGGCFCFVVVCCYVVDVCCYVVVVVMLWFLLLCCGDCWCDVCDC